MFKWGGAILMGKSREEERTERIIRKTGINLVMGGLADCDEGGGRQSVSLEAEEATVGGVRCSVMCYDPPLPTQLPSLRTFLVCLNLTDYF